MVVAACDLRVRVQALEEARKVGGTGATASRETRMALWWIWMDGDGGGGGIGTMVGRMGARRPRIKLASIGARVRRSRWMGWKMEEFGR